MYIFDFGMADQALAKRARNRKSVPGPIVIVVWLFLGVARLERFPKNVTKRRARI
jgi:hypothetical protein